MSVLSDLRFRLRALFQRRAMEQELDDELRFHFEKEVEKHRAAGLAEDEARRQVRLAFGGQSQVAEDCREARGIGLLNSVLRDMRYALRQMRKSPGFAATVIGTLALGIGAAAAMFTVVDHVLLQPTSYRHPTRLIALHESDGTRNWDVPWPDLRQWIEQSHSFQQIAFSTGFSGRNYLESDHAGIEINGAAVSANLFDTLGVKPQLGRGFVPEPPSFASRNAGLIVLSDVVWKEAFDGDPHILGQTVRINNTPYTVAGIMPAGFQYPAVTTVGPRAWVWVGFQLGPQDNGRDWKSDRFQVIARLRPGVSRAQAQTEMATIQRRIAAALTDLEERKEASLIRMQRYDSTLVNTDLRKALLALLAASGILWLIAAMNVTNLLLARSTARQREIAMRGALGAGRARIVQQMLVEGLIFSLSAAVLGAGLGLISVRLLGHELSERLPLPVPAAPDGSVLLALLGLTIFTALLSSTWPAWTAARSPIERALRQGGMQAGMGRRHHRIRGSLVSVEIALSLTLLVACGLLLRTLYSLRHVPLGYRTDHIVVAHLGIPSFRFAHRDMTQQLYVPLLQRAQHLPGVQAAALISAVPLGATFTIHFEMQLNSNTRIVSVMKAVTPDVQRVFGFKMAAGRFFNDQDTSNSQPVVVVNEAFARLYSPDKNNPNEIIGAKLLKMRNTPTVIVGILDDARQGTAVGQPSQPEADIDIRQLTPEVAFYHALEGIAMDLALRTSQPAVVMIPNLRQILHAASPELASANIATMDEIVEDSWASQRLAGHLLEIFGGSALLLCVAGLYGLLAYVVNQRTREIGVRVALGAPRNNVLWLVLRQAAAMLAVGVVVGVGLALDSGRLAQGFLYGVKPHDAWTLAGAAALLFVCGMLAAYLPARRAAGVDPMEALRSE
jgi:predicted permease